MLIKESILFNPMLTAFDKMVYIALKKNLDYKRSGNWTKILTYKDIHVLIGLKRNVVSRSLNFLERMEFIEIDRKQHGRLFHLKK